MATTLMNILLILTGIWMVLAIIHLLKLLQHPTYRKEKKSADNSSVTKEQIEEARHLLVGRSKPFTSRVIPAVPAVSTTEKAVDKPDTFADPNAEKGGLPSENWQETKDTGNDEQQADEQNEEENEMQVSLPMEETDEEEMLREELQIADEQLPEVSPSAILTRDLARITHWSKQDESLTEENEHVVTATLRTIRGSELMERLKEVTLQQEEAHRNILSAIRKAEEMEEETTEESERFTPTPPNHLGEEQTNETDDKPLSYYL